MKEKTKEFLKKYLIGFILGFVSVGIVVVYAETYFPSNEVSYDNSESGLSSTDVQGAIDELYGVCTAEPAGEQIIEDAGLEKDPYECRYFFTGANPNNYITFNDEKAGWRIISVECDGAIKIMRSESIGSEKWDDYGNTWGAASLNRYLNNTYYNTLTALAKEQIFTGNFSIGKTGGGSKLEKQIGEENSITWNGKIALITASEYIRANNDSSCSSFSSLSYNTRCNNTNWMFFDYSWWTLSQLSSNIGVSIAVSPSSGWSIMDGSEISFGIRPALYLSSEVKITGGDGSQSNPYQVSL